MKKEQEEYERIKACFSVEGSGSVEEALATEVGMKDREMELI